MHEVTQFFAPLQMSVSKTVKVPEVLILELPIDSSKETSLQIQDRRENQLHVFTLNN